MNENGVTQSELGAPLDVLRGSLRLDALGIVRELCPIAQWLSIADDGSRLVIGLLERQHLCQRLPHITECARTVRPELLLHFSWETNKLGRWPAPEDSCKSHGLAVAPSTQPLAFRFLVGAHEVDFLVTLHAYVMRRQEAQASACHMAALPSHGSHARGASQYHLQEVERRTIVT